MPHDGGVAALTPTPRPSARQPRSRCLLIEVLPPSAMSRSARSTVARLPIQALLNFRDVLDDERIGIKDDVAVISRELPLLSTAPRCGYCCDRVPVGNLPMLHPSAINLSNFNLRTPGQSYALEWHQHHLDVEAVPRLIPSSQHLARDAEQGPRSTHWPSR